MMKDRYESGDLARERDEKVIRPANPKNMDPSAGVNWAQMEPHDVLDQIDVMLVNGFGQQVQYKVPINQDGSDR